MFTIISTIDGHTIDTANSPSQARDRSWWRRDALVINNTTTSAFRQLAPKPPRAHTALRLDTTTGHAGLHGATREGIMITAFEQRMAQGHLNRTGHALRGHYEGEGFERHLVRECCGVEETAPSIITNLSASRT